MKPLLDEVQSRIKSDFSLDKMLAMFSIPIDRHLSKKNGRPAFSINGRGVLGKTNELRKAERYLEAHFKQQALTQKIYTPIIEPIWCVYHFYYTLENYITKDGYMRKTIGDLSNLFELPSDSLQKAGVIANDSQICSLDLSRRLVGPETKLEVFILKYEDRENPQWNLLR